jgi:hypothetical protein
MPCQLGIVVVDEIPDSPDMIIHDQPTPVTFAIPRREILSKRSRSINFLFSSETVLLLGLMTNWRPQYLH